jgi:DNA-binding transcriptional regulator YiaG
MAKNSQISDMIATLGSRRDLANALGTKLATVHKWAQSGRIPSAWQAKVVDVAQERGESHVTGDWMVEAHRVEVVSQ